MLLDLLQGSRVTQIIDLRHIPHFLFGRSSRALFFEALEKLGIRYFSVTAASSIPGQHESLAYDLLRQHLQQGPSMVFSDLEPSTDTDIATVIGKLNDAGIKFVRVFATV